MAAEFKTRDRTRHEHLARVERVVWESPEGDAVILRLLDGASAIGPGNREQFTTGQQYRFLGRWQTGGKFGDEFRFETFCHDQPFTRGAVVAYLSKTCRGIGRVTADKLFDMFGPAAVQTLREEPAAVVSAGLMTADTAAEASADLAAFTGFEATKVTLFGLFAGRGLGKHAIKAAITAWGAKAPEVIQRDPFKLLVKKIPGAGFKRCDQMFLATGGRPDAARRQAVAAWNAIREDRSGSTWVDARDTAATVKKAIPDADPYRSLKVLKRANWIRVRRDGKHQDPYVTLTERAEAEQQVADAVRALSRGPSLWPASLTPSESPGDGRPSAHQTEQWARATAGPFGCFVGGPGTGKTFTLSAALRLITASQGTSGISVVAPTGKAAVRARDALREQGVGVGATTIHRLLEIGRNGRDGSGWGFQRNRANPIDAQFLLVDEASMIGTGLMASLLSACVWPMVLAPTPELRIPAGRPIPPRCLRCHRELTDPDSWAIGFGPDCAKRTDPSKYRCLRPTFRDTETVIPARPELILPGTQVLIIGDQYQLAPVEHGAPLRDFLLAGVPSGELTEVRRNSGSIVRACQAIKAGTSVAFDSRLDLDAADPANLRLLECDANETADVLGEVLAGMTKFDPKWETQIITGVNEKSDVSRKEINDRFGRHLNPSGREARGNRFRVGDKIIKCEGNTELPAVELASRFRGDTLAGLDAASYVPTGDTEPVYIANGEIGRVYAVSEKHTVARFGGETSPLVRFANSKPKSDDAGQGEESGAGSAGDFELAWAITVHRSQGSEWPCVIVMVDDAAAGIADRNWWYTAISRGRKAVIVIGPKGTFERQAKRVTVDKRRTFLPQLLAELAEAAV